MLRLALIFVLLVLLAAVIGFSLAAEEPFTASRIVLTVGLVLAVVWLLRGYRRVPLD
jgi:uncharacterized membrane protein YtjA (UPF0391 family)